MFYPGTKKDFRTNIPSSSEHGRITSGIDKTNKNKDYYPHTSSSPPAVKSYKALPDWGLPELLSSSSWDPKLRPPRPARGFSNDSFLCSTDVEYEGGSSRIWSKGKHIRNHIHPFCKMVLNCKVHYLLCLNSDNNNVKWACFLATPPLHNTKEIIIA